MAAQNVKRAPCARQKGSSAHACTDASPIVTPVLPKLAPSPFELVGTAISATNTFAVLKEADQSVLTVHAGDRINGYTIAAIACRTQRRSVPTTMS
jgi:hypothetical protein